MLDGLYYLQHKRKTSGEATNLLVVEILLAWQQFQMLWRSLKIDMSYHQISSAATSKNQFHLQDADKRNKRDRHRRKRFHFHQPLETEVESLAFFGSLSGWPIA